MLSTASNKNSFKQKKKSLFSQLKESHILHHDNANFHTAQLMKDLLQEFDWEKLLHSPDLAPSDYYLLRRLQNHLDGLRLISRKMRTCFGLLFCICKVFYKCGIYKFVYRLKEVQGSNGG